MGKLPVLARVYIAVVASAGFSSIAAGIWFWQCDKPSRFLVYLAASLLCSGLKVRLPGIQGTMSVNYLVFVAGFIQLSLPETLMLGLASCLLQSFWYAKERPRAIQVVFNITSIAIAITGGYFIYHLDSVRLVGLETHPVLRLATATCAYYWLNTASIAVVIALTEHRSAFQTWKDSYFWSLSYYLLGASIADAPILLNKDWDWQMVLLVGPIVYVVYRSFRLETDMMGGDG